MTFKAYTTSEQIDLPYVSQGRVRTAVRRGGQFCCSYVANLLKYLYAKNFKNIMRFDKVIAKIIRVECFCLTVYIGYYRTAFVSYRSEVNELLTGQHLRLQHRCICMIYSRFNLITCHVT